MTRSTPPSPAGETPIAPDSPITQDELAALFSGFQHDLVPGRRVEAIWPQITRAEIKAAFARHELPFVDKAVPIQMHTDEQTWMIRPAALAAYVIRSGIPIPKQLVAQVGARRAAAREAAARAAAAPPPKLLSELTRQASQAATAARISNAWTSYVQLLRADAMEPLKLPDLIRLSGIAAELTIEPEQLDRDRAMIGRVLEGKQSVADAASGRPELFAGVGTSHVKLR